MLMTILVGQCSSTCFGRCHPSDLPGHLTKAKAAWHCISLLCSTVSAFCLWDALSGHAAVSSQALHDDEIPMAHPAHGREHEGGVTLFLRSIYYEFPLLATAGCRTLGWMEFESGLVVPSDVQEAKELAWDSGSSQAFTASAFAFVDQTHKVLKKQEDACWQI